MEHKIDPSWATGSTLCRRFATGSTLFHAGIVTFSQRVRRYAAVCNIKDAGALGTHAFRKGMAQDVVSAGGSLATLLRAGDWHSKAFFAYLRDSQAQDEAVAQLVINASDSEPE